MPYCAPRQQGMYPAIISSNLVQVVSKQVQHRVDVNHVRVDVKNSEDNEEDCQRYPLFPAVKGYDQKRNDVGHDVGHRLRVPPVKRRNLELHSSEGLGLSEVEQHPHETAQPNS